MTEPSNLNQSRPMTGPFYYHKGCIIAPEGYMKHIDPVTLDREVLQIDGYAGEHRDLWDNYMLVNFPEIRDKYDDNHKAMPRGRVDCKKVVGELSFWVTLDKCITDKEAEIKHIFGIEQYDVEFHYGTMNYKCKHCR